MIEQDWGARKVDVRLPGKGSSNSHGARPVHLIITIRWIRTSRLSIKNSLFQGWTGGKKVAHEQALITCGWVEEALITCWIDAELVLKLTLLKLTLLKLTFS